MRKTFISKYPHCSGSKYDGDGNYKNWWTPIDRDNFDERVQCIKDEYSGFYFEEADKNLNGDLTAGENTADNGGLWEARYGYDWYLKETSDIYVPGLSDKFTPDQLFYIGYAQIWCAKYKVNLKKFKLILNDSCRKTTLNGWLTMIHTPLVDSEPTALSKTVVGSSPTLSAARREHR